MLSKMIAPTILAGCLVSGGACALIKANPSLSPDSPTSPTLPSSGIIVRPANSTWIEEQFTTEVVNLGLEALGYTVEDIQQADYAALHTAIADGDWDFTTGFYQDGQNNLFEQAGGDEKLEKVSILVPGSGQQSIFIDTVTATQYQISTITQLQDPEIAKLFDTDGDGKANLAGCQMGWNCGTNIDHFIDVYGLTDTVEQDRGHYTELLAGVLDRHRQGQPFLLYAFSPHWIFLALKPGEAVLPLEVPFTSLPGGLAYMTEADTTVDDKNLGFPVSKQTLLANQQFVDENPLARRWFEVVKIPVEAVNAESLRIHQNGEDTPEDIRRHAEDWVRENQTLFDSWLRQARTVAD